MRCSVVTERATQIKSDSLIIGVYEDIQLPELVHELDVQFHGFINRCWEEGEIHGRSGEFTLIHSPYLEGPKRILVVGMGKLEDVTSKKIRQASAEAIRKLRDIKCKYVTSLLLGSESTISKGQLSAALIEGVLLGHYRFHKYFSQPSTLEVQRFDLICTDQSVYEKVCKGFAFGMICAEETNFSKDICNEPSNVVTPKKMAEIAVSLAEKLPFTVTILDNEQLQEKGFGLINAVSQGSIEAPYLIVIEYKKSEKNKTVGLVGKGVTFDSGGISLKAGSGMYTMKRDLTGGAVVMAVMKAVARLECAVNLVGVIPCAENMVGGRAYKPGDILTSLSGKTVEIFNTDAEGRLLLADALTYIQDTFDPSLVIDVATLTGGSIQAVGPRIIPFFSNEKAYVNKIIEAGERAGETLWQFPLHHEYLERVNSHFADLKNDTNKPPQTIIGALFLHEFINQSRPWMHFDIAALDTSDAEYSYISRGASGVAVRTLIRFITENARDLLQE